MIPQSYISKLSNRLFKEQGGKRIPENVLERDYCIAWFLVGLSRTIFLIKFESAYRSVKRHLRQAGITCQQK